VLPKPLAPVSTTRLLVSFSPHSATSRTAGTENGQNCASILRPDIINDVHATFTDLLDGPSGQVAQLAAHR
jgi:hypothetical protein